MPDTFDLFKVEYVGGPKDGGTETISALKMTRVLFSYAGSSAGHDRARFHKYDLKERVEGNLRRYVYSKEISEEDAEMFGGDSWGSM
jgi:hypothetical protein